MSSEPAPRRLAALQNLRSGAFLGWACPRSKSLGGSARAEDLAPSLGIIKYDSTHDFKYTIVQESGGNHACSS